MSDKRIFLIPFGVFVLVFLLHASYLIHKKTNEPFKCLEVEARTQSPLKRYFLNQDHFLSYSYALAGAFTAFVLFTMTRSRRLGGVGLLGGTSLIGVLYLIGCWLVGCCGSPLLTIYASLSGAHALGLRKAFVAAITTASVGMGYLWMRRRMRRECCRGAPCGLPKGGQP